MIISVHNTVVVMLVADCLGAASTGIFHCSAQSKVRPALQVLLQPNKETLAKRVQERSALGLHFMPASLLESQLALLEFDPTAYTYGTPPTFTPGLLHSVSMVLQSSKL